MITDTEVFKVETVADVRTGYQSRGKIEPDAASPYRIIQLRDVKEDVDWETVIAFKPERDPSRYLVADGDVLLSCRGGVHVGVVLADVPENTVVSGNLYVLRVRTGRVLPSYLAWYLNQPAAQEFLLSRSRGSDIALLARADVAELDVPVPPLAVQQRVVTLAGLRRTERNLLRELEGKRDRIIATICQSAIHRATHTEA